MKVNKNEFLTQCALFVALLTISAQITIPGVASVPFTLQTLVILVIALTTSCSLTLTSLSVYLIMGFAGIPVFAKFGGGPLYLSTPTGGYLIGFLIFGSLISLIKIKSIYGNMLLVAIFTIGVYVTGSLFALFNGFGLNFYVILTTWNIPFIGPDIFKAGVAVFIASKINKSNFLKTNYKSIKNIKVAWK